MNEKGEGTIRRIHSLVKKKGKVVCLTRVLRIIHVLVACGRTGKYKIYNLPAQKQQIYVDVNFKSTLILIVVDFCIIVKVDSIQILWNRTKNAGVSSFSSGGWLNVKWNYNQSFNRSEGTERAWVRSDLHSCNFLCDLAKKHIYPTA